MYYQGHATSALPKRSPSRHYLASRFDYLQKVTRHEVRLPKSPCFSSSGPAVKKRTVLGPLLAPSRPNCKAQSPSIESGLPSGLLSLPWKTKLLPVSVYALI